MPIDPAAFAGYAQPMPATGQHVVWTRPNGDRMTGVITLVWFGIEPMCDTRLDGIEGTKVCFCIPLGDRWEPA